MADIRTTNVNGVITGRLSEKSLEMVKTEMEIDGKKQNVDTVRGKISVETDAGTFEVNVYSSAKFKSGSDNFGFKSAKKIMDEYETGHMMQCKVSVSVNDYVSNDGTVRSGNRISLNSAKTVNEDEETCAEFSFDGYVAKIADEKNGENDTGRKIVSIVTVGYGEKAQPYNIYVADEDLVDSIDDYYSVGDTAILYTELKNRRVGGEETKTKKSAFGRKAKVSSGYDVPEFILIGGENPYDEDDTDKDGNVLVYDKKIITKLMNERKLMLENLPKEAEKKNKNSSSKKSTGLGSKTKHSSPIVDDEEEEAFDLF